MSLRITIFDDNKNIRESINMLLATVPGVGCYDIAMRLAEDVLRDGASKSKDEADENHPRERH